MFHGPLDNATRRGLIELRNRIAEENIPSSQIDESINLATWNIREFGKKRRKDASIHYIAEILYQFDIIAITELRENISDLAKVIEILGPYWKVVFSDYTPDRGGNKERMAYLYDSRAAIFTGLASEADAPRKKNHDTGDYELASDWWRPPFMASFRAGSFDFVMIAAHIRWGKKAKDRIAPLKMLAEWIDKRKKSEHNIDDDIVLLGDFNIPSFDDDLYDAITCKGLITPKALLQEQFGSNLGKNRRYDQIFHYPVYNESLTTAGGVLDFYRDDPDSLFPEENMTKTEFTYELSDHLPLWIQLDVNNEYTSLSQKFRFLSE